MSRRIARLKPKKIKGRIQVLKALPYRKNMIYVRRINEDIFEYLVVFNKEVYSSYMVITPKKGQTKLTKDEISQCAELLWAGGVSTLNMLLGQKLDKETEKIVETFEASRKSMEGVN